MRCYHARHPWRAPFLVPPLSNPPLGLLRASVAWSDARCVTYVLLVGAAGNPRGLRGDREMKYHGRTMIRRLFIFMVVPWIVGAAAACREVERSDKDTEDRLAQWRIQEILRIGDLDGTGSTVFARIGPIGVDTSGVVYVLDAQASELRVFDGVGQFLRATGRSGAGPGEIGGAIGMAFGQDGAVRIVDAANGRYLDVRRDGTTHSMRRPVSMYQLPWLGGFDRGGRFYDQATQSESGSTVDVLLAVGDDGQVTETFALPSAAISSPRMGSLTFPLPFAPRILRAWDPDGAVWQAVSSTYRIARVSLGGDTSLVVTKQVRSVELSNSQRDSVEAHIQSLRDQFGVTVSAEMRPADVPPLRWFVLDDRQNLWVCATAADPCQTLDVFDRTGSLRANVSVPVAILDEPRPVIRGDRLYAAILGAHDEPQLFIGRVVRE